MPRVFELRDQEITLAATEHNADELFKTLINKFGHDPESANLEVLRIVEPLELISAEEYEHFRAALTTS